MGKTLRGPIDVLQIAEFMSKNRCEKCGSKEIFRRYYKADLHAYNNLERYSWYDEKNVQREIPEHLYVQCQDCSYTWWEWCKDHSDKDSIEVDEEYPWVNM